MYNKLIKSKKWTIEEEQYLIDHHNINNVKILSQYLNRTEKAIRHRLEQLGLCKTISKYNLQIGYKFNKLTITNIKPKAIQCLCECGKITIVRNSYRLVNNHTKSCGCLRTDILTNKNITHNKSHTRLYNIWISMKTRCFNINDESYNNYGKRGIIICHEWLNFNNFYNWAIQYHYQDNLTLDRINNNGNYEPDNCRWVNHKTQCNNKRNNRYITIDNITKTMSEWIDDPICIITYTIFQSRLNRGWEPKLALTTPKYIKRNML